MPTILRSLHISKRYNCVIIRCLDERLSDRHVFLFFLLCSLLLHVSSPYAWVAPLFLLLAHQRFSVALAGSRIILRVLTSDRKSPSVADTPITSYVHQAFDVHRHFCPEIAFNFEVFLDRLPENINFFVRKVLYPRVWIDFRDLQDFLCSRVADPENIRKRNLACCWADLHLKYVPYMTSYLAVLFF